MWWQTWVDPIPWCSRFKIGPYGRSTVWRAPFDQDHVSFEKCGISWFVCWSQVYVVSHILITMYGNPYKQTTRSKEYWIDAAIKREIMDSKPILDRVIHFWNDLWKRRFLLVLLRLRFQKWLVGDSYSSPPVTPKNRYSGQPIMRWLKREIIPKMTGFRFCFSCSVIFPVGDVALDGTWVCPFSRWLQCAWCTAWLCAQL